MDFKEQITLKKYKEWLFVCFVNVYGSVSVAAAHTFRSASCGFHSVRIDLVAL